MDAESTYHIISISFLSFFIFAFRRFFSLFLLPDKLRLILRMLKMWNECVIFINFLLQTFSSVFLRSSRNFLPEGEKESPLKTMEMNGDCVGENDEEK